MKLNRARKESRQFTLGEFCSEFPQDKTTGEKKRARANRAKWRTVCDYSKVMMGAKMMPLPKPKAAPKTQKAVWVRKDRNLNVEAKEFVSHSLSTASKPFSYDYHTYYPLKAAPVLPLVVPNNDNWKQIAGDAMYEWVMMFYGDMTG